MTALDADTLLPAAQTSCQWNFGAVHRLAVASLLTWIAGGVFLASSMPGFAQPAKPAVAASAPSKPPATLLASKPAVSKPVWAELTVQQQIALRPLAPGWDTISEAQKRKWLEMSKGFPSLTPEGQSIMHSRMTEWVALSAQQRAQARLNFAKTKELSNELTPEEKQAKWQTYQALSAEEKQKLAAKASPKPAGAATAVKPVPPQKLAVVPPVQVPGESSKAPPTPAATPVQGDSALFGEGTAGSLPKR